MALIEYEKKILKQMEASLREEGLTLASQMFAPTVEEDPEPARGPHVPRRIALGLTGAVLGTVVLVAAVSLGYSVLSILLEVTGFALTIADILYTILRPGASSSESADKSSTRGAGKSNGQSSFIQDQERRWDGRRDNDWGFHTTDKAG